MKSPSEWFRLKILTRNNGSALKTSAWGIISGGYVG
jgi:hypothetical protein